jgi:FAD binding domain
MHKRVVPALSDGRRFLLGDSGHLSSPMGGEGINSALMDGANIAWKLALVLRGAAKPSLLATYGIERGLADRHVLEVSNEIHSVVMQFVEKCRAGEALIAPAQDPAEALAALRSARCSTSPTREAFSRAKGLTTLSLRQERAFPAGAISPARPITSSFPAARRGSTISERDGALSCQSLNGQAGASSRNSRG